jgi:hypothetical protein
MKRNVSLAISFSVASVECRKYKFADMQICGDADILIEIENLRNSASPQLCIVISASPHL